MIVPPIGEDGERKKYFKKCSPKDSEKPAADKTKYCMAGLMDNQQKVIDEKEKGRQKEGIGIVPGKGDFPLQSHPKLLGQHPAKWNANHRKPPFFYDR